MAENELEKLINGEGNNPKEPSGEKPPEKSEEVLKQEEQKANLDKAIAQANETLKGIRKQVKAEKAGVSLKDLEDEELPKINLENPDSRAWDRHITDKVNPVAAELAKEKEEVTGLALREFLADKPALANNPEKLKEFVRDFEALSNARSITGRNKDVVKSVMENAYGSVFREEVLAEARRTRATAARADSLMADVVTDEGGSAPLRNERPRRTALNREMQEAVISMYGSVDAYWETIEKNSPTT